MTRVRILEAATTREKARFDVPHLASTDGLTALLILARECRTRGLGDPDRYRIQLWDQRRGWVEYRPHPG